MKTSTLQTRNRVPPSNYKSLMAVFLAALILGACASNPTGGANFVLMTERSEIAKGKELHEQMLLETPIYNDPDLQAYVEKVGKKVAAAGDRPDLEYHFTIIDSPDINAFALPGGYVYINRGLLVYLTSEAQLAAVLGHEIGHIAARHAVRQQTASRTASVLSAALIFATGVSQLGEATSLFGGALLSGYGRDMELEADSLGAEYLFNAGYDPMAMVEVITVLKNHEDFTKKTSNRGVSYHGLFASHPRNDTRLQEVVGNAGSLSALQVESNVDASEFREQLSGLPIGLTLQSVNTQDRNRYYQNLLNYTMIFPDNWSTEETTTTITAHDENALASLKVEVRRLRQSKDPRLFIREDLNISELQRTEILSQYGLPGYTGIQPDTQERIAVIYYGPRAYIFTGKVSSETPENTDQLILEAIKTFRPIARNERMLANPVHIAYIQADGQMTYADLARSSRITEYPEDQLRLFNGDYPSGEPQPGEWIKIAN